MGRKEALSASAVVTDQPSVLKLHHDCIAKTCPLHLKFISKLLGIVGCMIL